MCVDEIMHVFESMYVNEYVCVNKVCKSMGAYVSKCIYKYVFQRICMYTCMCVYCIYIDEWIRCVYECIYVCVYEYVCVSESMYVYVVFA